MRLKAQSYGFVLFFIFGIQGLGARDKVALPTSMAALGDSITAGALAGFSRSDAHNPFAMPKFLFYLGKLGYLGSLHALELPSRSWSTGMSYKVRSHARRLSERNEAERENLAIYNAAVSGSNSENLDEQVAAILKWAQTSLGQGAPDYVTLEMGANDACARNNDEMTPTSRYANNLHQALDKILRANPQTHILVGGIPNVEHLRNVARNSWLGILPPFSRCKDIWKAHKFCQNMLLEKDVTKRKEITARIHDYMSETEEVLQSVNDLYGEDKVRYASEINDYKFSDDEISLDCFHPNWRGHQALADITWAKTWWAH